MLLLGKDIAMWDWIMNVSGRTEGGVRVWQIWRPKYKDLSELYIGRTHPYLSPYTTKNKTKQKQNRKKRKHTHTPTSHPPTHPHTPTSHPPTHPHTPPPPHTPHTHTPPTHTHTPPHPPHTHTPNKIYAFQVKWTYLLPGIIKGVYLNLMSQWSMVLAQPLQVWVTLSRAPCVGIRCWANQDRITLFTFWWRSHNNFAFCLAWTVFRKRL